MAALELVNAPKLVTATSVEPNQVKAFPAFTPTLIIEGLGDVCIVAVSPVSWVSLGLATLSLIDVVKPLPGAGLEDSAEVVAAWAGRPFVIPVDTI